MKMFLRQKKGKAMSILPAAKSNKPFEVAEQKFKSEAAAYCAGISDNAAHLYAQRYTEALVAETHGGPFQEPHNTGVFGPNRNWIRRTLRSLYRQHFPPRWRNLPTAQVTIAEAEYPSSDVS